VEDGAPALADQGFAYGHPLDRTALTEWMKYPSIQEMDADHDRLHELVCDMLAVRSYSLAKRDGATLSQEEEDLAACEEAAILHLQRWLRWLVKHSKSML
jgi:hypothetical protein